MIAEPESRLLFAQLRNFQNEASEKPPSPISRCPKVEKWTNSYIHEKTKGWQGYRKGDENTVFEQIWFHFL